MILNIEQKAGEIAQKSAKMNLRLRSKTRILVLNYLQQKRLLQPNKSQPKRDNIGRNRCILILRSVKLLTGTFLLLHQDQRLRYLLCFLDQKFCKGNALTK
ncbi:unnamed protein product [Moneuplotes crassus]|uniref:Uncharacterized protein n=1 Tax=Euplotes crassus TaxID=5936 RepID=A0AAD1Y4A5_EUPCR|nr:unnamed protein product [Moneuplotes crassus]